MLEALSESQIDFLIANNPAIQAYLNKRTGRRRDNTGGVSTEFFFAGYGGYQIYDIVNLMLFTVTASKLTGYPLMVFATILTIFLSTGNWVRDVTSYDVVGEAGNYASDLFDELTDAEKLLLRAQVDERITFTANDINGLIGAVVDGKKATVTVSARRASGDSTVDLREAVGDTDDGGRLIQEIDDDMPVRQTALLQQSRSSTDLSSDPGCCCGMCTSCSNACATGTEAFTTVSQANALVTYTVMGSADIILLFKAATHISPWTLILGLPLSAALIHYCVKYYQMQGDAKLRKDAKIIADAVSCSSGAELDEQKESKGWCTGPGDFLIAKERALQSVFNTVLRGASGAAIYSQVFTAVEDVLDDLFHSGHVSSQKMLPMLITIGCMTAYNTILTRVFSVYAKFPLGTNQADNDITAEEMAAIRLSKSDWAMNTILSLLRVGSIMGLVVLRQKDNIPLLIGTAVGCAIEFACNLYARVDCTKFENLKVLKELQKLQQEYHQITSRGIGNADSTKLWGLLIRLYKLNPSLKLKGDVTNVVATGFRYGLNFSFLGTINTHVATPLIQKLAKDFVGFSNTELLLFTNVIGAEVLKAEWTFFGADMYDTQAAYKARTQLYRCSEESLVAQP